MPAAIQDQVNLQRALTTSLISKHKLTAPAVWFKPETATPDATGLDTDLSQWVDQNIGLQLVDGMLELQIKAPDDGWARGFFEACAHTQVDARFAYGPASGRVTAVLFKIADPDSVDRWRDVWPRGFKSKGDSWVETTFAYSLSPTSKTAKPVLHYSHPLPGSTFAGELVAWRPMGKPIAADLELGEEDIEASRSIAVTSMEAIIRAAAYATIVYWVRVDLEGLERWDETLVRIIGGWLARVVGEGDKINKGMSLEGKCWSPIDTQALAVDLIEFLQRVAHAPIDLKDAFVRAAAQLERDRDAKAPGWASIEDRLTLQAMVGIRRALRAGLDISVIEQLAERYVLDTTTHLYVDRDHIAKGLKFEFEHASLVRQHANSKIWFGKKSHNAFGLFSQSPHRIDVKATDFLPAVPPAAIVRYSPVLGILGADADHHDEYAVVNSFPGFPVKAIERPDPGILAYIDMAIKKMFGLLTNSNLAQMHWLKQWVAYIIQNPHKKQQIAPVLIGGQSIGKSRFGQNFMRALFGSMAGSVVMTKDDKFIITPFLGKLVTFVDEAKLESVASINMLKQLIREDYVPGQLKGRDHHTYYLPSRLILAANQVDIGLTADDSADRALFFIMGCSPETMRISKVEFLAWVAAEYRGFYEELVTRLQDLRIRQHLMYYFSKIKVDRRDLEDLTHSSKDDESVVRSTMSSAREVAMRIVSEAHVIYSKDITAWFNTLDIRKAIQRTAGYRTTVTDQQVLSEWQRAEVVENQRGNYWRFKWGYGKLLEELGKAWTIKLDQPFDFQPDDFADNNVMTQTGGREWRGIKQGHSREERGFGSNQQRSDPDFMDPF